MARKKPRTINAFYLYGTLALALTDVSTILLGSEIVGLLGYVFMLLFVVLLITGFFQKKVRLSLATSDKLLAACGVLLLLVNVWILVGAFLPTNSSLYLDYINYWQGWPAIPFSLLLAGMLLRVQRPVAKRLALATLSLIVITLVGEIMMYARLYTTNSL